MEIAQKRVFTLQRIQTELRMGTKRREWKAERRSSGMGEKNKGKKEEDGQHSALWRKQS